MTKESMTEESLPQIVVATIEKTSPDALTGITLAYSNKKKDAVTITKISKSSAFNDTDLQVGFEILAINGKTNIKSRQEAIRLIKDAPTTVSILASSSSKPKLPEYYSMHTVAPPARKGQSLHVRFEQYRGTLVRVAYIGKSSPFANTSLQVGDIVISVNGQAVGEPNHASRLILTSDAAGVTLLTWDMQSYRESEILQPITGYRKEIFHHTKQWIGPDYFSVGQDMRNARFERVSFQFNPNGQVAVASPWHHLRTQADITKLGGDWQTGELFYDAYMDGILRKVEQKNISMERQMVTIAALVEAADIGEYGVDYN